MSQDASRPGSVQDIVFLPPVDPFFQPEGPAQNSSYELRLELQRSLPVLTSRTRIPSLRDLPAVPAANRAPSPEPPERLPESVAQSPEAHLEARCLQAPPKGPSPFISSTSRDTRKPLKVQTTHRPMEIVFVKFMEVAAHTAKCDLCDERNRDGMSRCQTCGWQCCRRCYGDRGGNCSHQSFKSIHASEESYRTSSLGANPGTPTSNATPREQSSSFLSSPPPSEEQQAAEALMNMSSSPPGAKCETSPRGGQRTERSESMIAQRGDFSDSENETISMPDSDITGGDLDLPESMVNVRRNPSRKARPADLSENQE
ncbi:hypothetical protein N7462_010710 [Penicillium macrosclerotiorum]|uniref:uncharacterized protein n=1 Tax=Penicillium macrosclerotiorum TaxID=303699 RepID=UPI002549333A|nr:uncharacterized protein N7462_010710 [Penicillium macrosclerotiorum]KAJ5669640.1 hypothetical protein N7462_010710 [Penicillium macrosclerotiorum]